MRRTRPRRRAVFLLRGSRALSSPLILLVPLAAPRRVAQRLAVHDVTRSASIREVDCGGESALAQQAHALVGMAHGVWRNDHVFELEQRVVRGGRFLLEHAYGGR